MTRVRLCGFDSLPAQTSLPSRRPAPILASDHANKRLEFPRGIISAVHARSSLWRTPADEARLRAWYERVLARLPVAHEAIDVPTTFGRTHVVAVGRPDAPSLVLLHGTNANGLSWRPQLVGLAARYRIYAIDVLGSAGLSDPVRLPEHGPAQGRWLAATLDGLHVDVAHVAGISGGAWLVLKLAVVACERIRSAALLSAAGLLPLRLPFRFARLPGFLTMADWFNAQTVRSTEDARRVLVRLGGSPTRGGDEGLELFTMIMRSFRNQPPPDALPDAEQRRLVAPTLVLMGEREALFNSRAVIAQARRTLPDLRAAEIVPGAGHALSSDHADLVNARLDRFFSTLS